MNTSIFRRAAPVVSALLVGLASGWSLKQPGATHPVPIACTPRAKASANLQGTPHDRDLLRSAWTTGSGGEQADGSMPAPFQSLDELVELIAGFDLFDEVSSVQLMTGLPRLLTTDLPTTRRLLDELAAAPNVPEEARKMIAMSLLARWVMQEPEAAILYAQCHANLFDADTSEEFGGLGLALLARRDPGKARALLSILPEDKRSEAEELLTMCEALDDPETYLTTKPLEEIDNARELAAAWARRDPRAASRWAMSLTQADEETDADDIIAAVAGGWALKERNAALAWAGALPLDTAKAEAFKAIARVMTEGMTLEQAGPVLAGLPPDVADHVVLSLVGDETPPGSSDLFADALFRHAAEEDFQQEASRSADRVARSLAREKDGAAAAVWVARLPDGSAKASAVEALANEWAGKDVVAASEWVAGLPQGDLRSRAAVGLIERIAGDDPERALVWAASIGTEEVRNEQTGKVLRAWLPVDPYAAMSAVEALPGEVRAAIWKREE